MIGGRTCPVRVLLFRRVAGEVLGISPPFVEVPGAPPGDFGDVAPLFGNTGGLSVGRVGVPPGITDRTDVP